MKHETVFIPVKVSESPLADQNHWYVKRPLDAVRQPVEPLTNRYVFTKEELEERDKINFDNGVKWRQDKLELDTSNFNKSQK